MGNLRTHSIDVEGDLRSYLLYRPDCLRDSEAASPLVLAFHGSGTTASQMVDFCGLNEMADVHGFLVAYPNGSGRVDHARSFNAGRCCGYASKHDVNDVGFVDAILDELIQSELVAPERVFATGMSAGAMMCYRLAVEIPDRIAGIAPVAGAMECDMADSQRPIPVCHFHGTEDAFVPYSGGYGTKSLSRVSFTPVEATVKSWLRANRCVTPPTVRNISDHYGDGTSVLVHSYESELGAPVELHQIRGGGHTWPGREPTFDGLGRATSNLKANEVIVDFFNLSQ